MAIRFSAFAWVRAALLAAFALALIATALPEIVSAQTFYTIRGDPRVAPPPPFAQQERYSNPFSDFFGIFRNRDRDRELEEKEKAERAAFGNYCVRTCDGKFFPVNRGQRTDIQFSQICNAMCPAAATKIYSGAGIENAVATDGQKYMSLPNALAYRTRIVQGCTCNGRDPFGVVSVDLENDPTLRAGDIVVRPQGIAVYQGDISRNKDLNFTPFRQARGLSPVLVKQLAAIRILQNNPNAPRSMTIIARPTSPEALEKIVAPQQGTPQQQQKNTPTAGTNPQPQVQQR